MRLPDFVTTWLLTKLRARCENRRPPDVHIGGKKTEEIFFGAFMAARVGTPIYYGTYLERWWVIPRNRLFNAYFHRFMRSDDDRALHDHPWVSVSIVLAGRFWEIMPVDQDNPAGETYKLLRSRGEIIIRPKATFAHRIQLIDGVDGQPMNAWTLFLTGPVVRPWGFWCPQGWRDYKTFTTGSPDGTHTYEGNGPGCGEL